MLHLSLNHITRGKDKTTVGIAPYTPARVSPSELAQHSFWDGLAFTAGIFTGHKKDNAHWLGASAIITDIDHISYDDLDRINAAGGIIPFLLQDGFIRKHAALIKVSSSYTPEEPRAHIVFGLDDEIQVIEAYERLHQYVSAQIPLTADKATQRASQAIYGTEFTSPCVVKSDNLVYANDLFIPIQGVQTLAEIHKAHVAGQPYNGYSFERLTEFHERSITRRSERHYEQDEPRRLKVVLEALSYALRDWGRRDYSEWLSMWFAAYDGCDGHNAVRDYILDHSDITWNDAGERALFRKLWDNHTPREGDAKKVRVASLFYCAQNQGWLKTTSVDLTEDDYESEYIEDIGAWLQAEQPRRLLLMSDTGTGKTRGTIQFVRDNLAGGRALFLAPTVRLCVNLSATLTELGVENTLYIDGDKIKQASDLMAAQVLVTTLQTFAVKLARTSPHKLSYDYVIIDESDDLISAFVRAGIQRSVGSQSHVSRTQARHGLVALSRLMNSAGHVILLDGTATKVSLHALRRLSPDTETRCVRNTFRHNKASVVMLDTIHEARERIENAVRDGLRVVIATDTRAEAHRMEKFIKQYELCPEREMIVLVGGGQQTEETKQFFTDVNKEAARHRVIIYNSAMGSGVSITEVKPDVVVQIGTHISARKNLQILNRFRQQGDVYIYIKAVETIYTQDVDERIENLNSAIEFEAGLIADVVARNDLARYTDEIARLAVRDELEQQRNMRVFYAQLLMNEGREVTRSEAEFNPDGIKDKFIDVYETMKHEREAAYNMWHEVEPVTSSIRPEGMTPTQHAAGYIHARVLRALGDDGKERGLSMYEPRLLAEMVEKYYYPIQYRLRYWLEPEIACDHAVKDAVKKENPRLSFQLDMTRLALLSLVGNLFDSVATPLSDDEAEERSMKFLDELEPRKRTYDAVVTVQRKKYESLARDEPDTQKRAMKYAKAILEPFGLKVKRKQRMIEGEREYVYQIQVKPVLDMLRIMGYDMRHDITLDGEHVTQARHDVQNALRLYRGLAPEEQHAIRVAASEDELFIDAVNTHISPL